jgi:integrase
MPLTDTSIRSTKPGAKPLKLFDGGGLYLLVNPTGSRWWRLKYRVSGREKLLSLGVYPDVSLKLARDRRDEARKLIAQGIDPSAQRQAEKSATSNTLEAIAREWHTKFAPGWAKSHGDKILRRLERNVFPWLGSRPIESLTAPDLLACLRRIEKRGRIDTAHRTHQNLSQVFRYAVATARATRDPNADLRGALPPPQREHYPTLTNPDDVGALLRAIEGYTGGEVVAAALRLAPFVFTRPGELRKARWSEFDLENKQWRIPAERMKSRAPHVVPLSDKALSILQDLQPLTLASGFVFPGRDGKKPISENTLNAALRRLGYAGDQFTAHSFRSMASTMLNEQGWSPDAIERQLAHGERDKVRAAYNHAEHMPERRKMMQSWADYLEALRKGAAVVPIRRRA